MNASTVGGPHMDGLMIAIAGLVALAIALSLPSVRARLGSRWPMFGGIAFLALLLVAAFGSGSKVAVVQSTLDEEVALAPLFSGERVAQARTAAFDDVFTDRFVDFYLHDRGYQQRFSPADVRAHTSVNRGALVYADSTPFLKWLFEPRNEGDYKADFVSWLANDHVLSTATILQLYRTTGSDAEKDKVLGVIHQGYSSPFGFGGHGTEAWELEQLRALAAEEKSPALRAKLDAEIAWRAAKG